MKTRLFENTTLQLVLAILFVGALTVGVSMFRSQPRVLGETTRALPTPTPYRTTPGEEAELSKAVYDEPFTLLSPYDQLRINEFKQKLPYRGTNIEIIYSDEVKRILIAFKNQTPAAQTELSTVLAKHNILELYTAHSPLFKAGVGSDALSLVAPTRQEIQRQIADLIAQKNVLGLAVQAQTQTPEQQAEAMSEDVNVPNQKDAAAVPDFFVDLLKGIPDDPEIETKGTTGSGGTPGGGTGGTGGTGNPVDPNTLPSGTVGEDQTTDVLGIRVLTMIAPQVNAMLSAMTAAGLDYSGSSGWRDPATQIFLRRQNCGPTDYDIYQRPSGECSPPTARPGTSNHERGLAIDFHCNGDTMRTGDACFNWMSANAANYGFYNLPSESWHWSVDGS